MSHISNKKYSDQVTGVERIADGIKLHSAEAGFPSILNEQTVRARRAALEEKRQTYEALANQAERAYDEFDAYNKECEADMAKWRSALYSFYGKKDPRLADFGISPWKTRKRGEQEEEKQE
jgi:hypothetical protein